MHEDLIAPLVCHHRSLPPGQAHAVALQYAQSREPALAERLIRANLRLVVKLAYQYSHLWPDLRDLVQEGNMGLVVAVRNYDPHRGVKLSTFAAWWIRAYMLRFIMGNWRLVKVGTTQVQRKLFFNLAKERQKLEAAGIVPTDAVLAERLAAPERDVTQMRLRLEHSEIGLDTPAYGPTDQLTILDLLADPGEGPDVDIERRELRQWLGGKLAAFQARLRGPVEVSIFHERLLADDEPLTLSQIGAEHGISRERVRQIEARLLDRLRSFLAGDTLQGFLAGSEPGSKVLACAP